MMRTQYWWGLAALGALATGAFCAALLVGSAGLSGHELAAGAARRWQRTSSQMIVRTVRLPRAAIAAFAVGSLLALAGVLLQALFRNPLADPLVLGVSGGAAVGALTAGC